MKSSIEQQVALCSWSLQPENAQQLVERVKATGLNRVQCALGPLRSEPDRWNQLQGLCAANQLQLVSGMFGTVGEDYSTLESIRQTGGLVPDQTWAENWSNIQAEARLASQLGLKLVTFHAGFLPHDPADPTFARLLARIRQVADLFANLGLNLAMETGQETAETLRDFLQHLDRPNLGVNFDPANMILYDKGRPIPALKTLGPWIRQCHIKDAKRTQVPGTWGEEVVVGTGEVDWSDFMQTLWELDFEGDLVIEREAGTQRVQDIAAAHRHLLSLVKEPGKNCCG